MSQCETLVEHRLYCLDLLHLVFGKIPVGALSADDPHSLRDVAAAFPMADLFLADTGHSGRVADTEMFFLGSHR